MPPRAPEEGPTHGRGEWYHHEHDAVFRALDEGLASVRFPASKPEIMQQAGGENIASVRDLPLVAYLEALPEARYASAQDVKEAINARWQDIRGLRGKGWGAAEQGGAIPEEMRR